MVSSSSPDIDNGWAFVTWTCIFITRIVTFGVSYSSAVLYTAVLDEFQQSPFLTAWAVNLHVFCLHVFGHLATFSIRLVGLRGTTAIGCIISTIGLLATAFASTLTWFFVTYGFLCGVGFSFIYFPQFEIIAQNFKSMRKMVFLICGSACSLGQLIFSPLLHYLLDMYNWRGAFIILCAINLNAFLQASAAIKPRIIDVLDDARDSLVVQIDDGQMTQHESASVINRFLKDLRLLSNLKFTAFLISGFLLCAGYGAFNTHFVNYAKVLGFDNSSASLLPSIFAISGILFSVVLSTALHVKQVDVLPVFVIMYILAGILVGIFGLLTSYVELAIDCLFLGFTTTLWAACPELVILFAGIDNLSIGFSYLCISSAFGIFLGGPIAAFCYELDPSYRVSFIVAGATLFIGGIMNLPGYLSIKCNAHRPGI